MGPGGLRVVPGERTGWPQGFELGFVDSESNEVRRPLAEVAAVLFERAPAVRAFPSYRGQRNYPGLYYAASMGAHVGFESWLERDEAMVLDFAPDVVAFASQPFWLFWPDGQRIRSHAPDFFARTSAGEGVVVDCRPLDRIRARDEAVFAVTEQACVEVGWSFRLVTGHDPVWLSNLRWLAGYRQSRNHSEAIASALLSVFAEPSPLLEGVVQVGDPLRVLPTLYHLLWAGELVADLSLRLESTSLVSVGGDGAAAAGR